MRRVVDLLVNLTISILVAAVITAFIIKSHSTETVYVVALFSYVIGRDLEMARRIDKEDKK
ncbi:MAG: hypothetical protein LKF37_09375 [Lentilactobacillus diolivorans]|jgi:hypothetical protein|nr:hypothetical protein [Lentilactobacillus diolivorans]